MSVRGVVAVDVAPRMSSNAKARRDADLIRLRGALKMLFDLLEAHAPTWYTREHHRISLYTNYDPGQPAAF
jgi:hypothetical protein